MMTATRMAAAAAATSGKGCERRLAAKRTRDEKADAATPGRGAAAIDVALAWGPRPAFLLGHCGTRNKDGVPLLDAAVLLAAALGVSLDELAGVQEGSASAPGRPQGVRRRRCGRQAGEGKKGKRKL
jgi:hypothetical protein